MSAADVADGPIPTHVACVMDGNGRWAARRGLPRTEGHAAGEAALLDAVEGALELGIPWITMYAFSTENWRRPADEVRYLMGFNESLSSDDVTSCTRRGCGSGSPAGADWRVPKRVLRRMDESIALTAGESALHPDHGVQLRGQGRDRRRGAPAGGRGVASDKVDEKAIRSRLYFPDQPDPDLVIRTSGEHRISNFLLWQLAYSELVFDDVLWPDFRRRHLFAAVARFPTAPASVRGSELMAMAPSPPPGRPPTPAMTAGGVDHYRYRARRPGLCRMVLMAVAGFTAAVPLVVIPPVLVGIIAANSLLGGGRGSPDDPGTAAAARPSEEPTGPT